MEPVKTVPEAVVDPAVELVPVLIILYRQQVQATHHLPVPHRAIQVESVLAMEVVAVVVPVAQDLQA